MKHNMGRQEKLVRLVGGLVSFIVGWLVLRGYAVFISEVATTTVIGIVLAFAGAIVFFTGMFSWCPLNALFRHNSCEACKVGETHRHLPV
ncbi:MAG: YgaP family membrane protein [Nitrospirota bacterium]